MRALVTGGTGFVGSNLVGQLAKKGIEVLVTGNESEQQLPDRSNVKRLYPSVFGIDWSKVGKIDVLFHEAALNETTNLDADEMLFGNYEVSKRLFQKVISEGCRHIVYASSTAVYGDAPAPYLEGGLKNPLNPYAESKLKLDAFAMGLAASRPDVKVVGLRYCNVYGPGENHKGKRASMVHQIAKQVAAGKNPKLFKWGEQKRDYIYVKDVVQANLLAAEADESCVVNCGFGQATSFKHLTDIIKKGLGSDVEIEYIDNPYSGIYQNHTECDMSLAKEMIGFVPAYDIEAGIRDALSYASFLK